MTMFKEFLQKVLKQDVLEINVAMLGPRRAGKTSMLTAMYERFENALLTERISEQMALSADPNTVQTLGDNYRKLISQIREGKDIAEAIIGDSDARSYQFELKRPGAADEVQIRLTFQDYPGGWLMSGRSNKADPNYQQVLSFVKKSEIVLVAVDAPYLMEADGAYHKRRNIPDLIADTINDAWGDDDANPHMVILVPIKCEKYDSTDRTGLIEATRNGYSELLSCCQRIHKCAVICAPAQTTGCVKFDHFAPMDADDDIPSPVFSMPKSSDERGYNPRDCSQTLRYCLVYTLKRFVKMGEQGTKGMLRKFFKLDGNFVKAAEILAAGCRGVFFKTM